MGTKVVPLKNKRKNKGGSDVNTLVVSRKNSYVEAASDETQNDELLSCLKESGKRLNMMLDIDEEKISAAIKECRKEWK